MMPRSVSVAVVLVCASLGACGGSSSETPWPVEPEGAALGPSGEAAPAGAAVAEAPAATDGGAPRQETRDAGSAQRGPASVAK
jgi:hypothetical protein